MTAPLSWATVKAVSPLLIRQDGASTNMPALNAEGGYAPVVGHRVIVAVVGRKMILLGHPV